MRPSNLRYLLVLPAFISQANAQSTTTSTTLSSRATSSSASASAITTTGVNRITYAYLPSCASSCVTAAVRSIPCAPFAASCFCALPTGRLAYELPSECVKRNCGGSDIDEEQKWRESVCAGFTGPTTEISLASRTSAGISIVTSSSSAARAGATELCRDGWKGCPMDLNGGCCPRDNSCNLLDCQLSTASPATAVTKISSPSEVPNVDIVSLFPPCSHQCMSQYLPQTSCGLSPLNSTCFCRLHEFFPCLSSCTEDEINTFVSSHLEICKALWYFTPYDSKSDRWCDLVEGEGKRGRPAGYDVRMGSLENKCPNWWEQRSAGKRFGIVIGIAILSFVFIFGCGGYWKYVAKKVDAIDKKREMERLKMMGLGG